MPEQSDMPQPKDEQAARVADPERNEEAVEDLDVRDDQDAVKGGSYDIALNKKV